MHLTLNWEEAAMMQGQPPRQQRSLLTMPPPLPLIAQLSSLRYQTLGFGNHFTTLSLFWYLSLDLNWCSAHGRKSDVD